MTDRLRDRLTEEAVAEPNVARLELWIDGKDGGEPTLIDTGFVGSFRGDVFRVPFPFEMSTDELIAAFARRINAAARNSTRRDDA